MIDELKVGSGNINGLGSYRSTIIGNWLRKIQPDLKVGCLQECKTREIGLSFSSGRSCCKANSRLTTGRKEGWSSSE